jgi:hypothetical protein
MVILHNSPTYSNDLTVWCHSMHFPFELTPQRQLPHALACLQNRIHVATSASTSLHIYSKSPTTGAKTSAAIASDVNIHSTPI